MTLPTSRVVKVTVTTEAGSGTQRGFGIPLFLTSVAKAGKVDADNRTRSYSTMTAVAADWASTDAFYLAAQAAFSQDPAPLTIKVGYFDGAVADAAALTAEVDSLVVADANFYWITPEAELRDTAKLDGLIAWTEANSRLAIITSNDAKLKDKADTTNIAARHKGDIRRTAIIYHEDATKYPDFALAATLGTYDFDLADSAFTAMFKDLEGIPVSNLPGGDVDTITGQTAGEEIDKADGHVTNVYVNVGGENIVLPGTTLTPNTFIDEIVEADWLKARCEEAVLRRFVVNRKIGYDDAGFEIIAQALREVGEAGRRAGLIAEDRNPTTGDYESSWQVIVPAVTDATATQRQNRISPQFTIRYRKSGVIQFANIDITARY